MAYVKREDINLYWDKSLADDALNLSNDPTPQQILEADILIEKLSLSKEIEISGWIKTRFKIKEEFEKLGDDRNPLMLENLVKLLILELETRKSMGMPSEYRTEKRKEIFASMARFMKGFENPEIEEVQEMQNLDYEVYPTKFVDFASKSNY
jgi:hypothetical protein